MVHYRPKFKLEAFSTGGPVVSSPNGELLACAYDDEVKARTQCACNFEQHDNSRFDQLTSTECRADCVGFDGQCLATATGGKFAVLLLIYLHSIADTSSLNETCLQDTTAVTAITFGSDGDVLFIASRSLQLQCWSLSSGNCLRTWKVGPLVPNLSLREAVLFHFVLH